MTRSLKSTSMHADSDFGHGEPEDPHVDDLAVAHLPVLGDVDALAGGEDGDGHEGTLRSSSAVALSTSIPATSRNFAPSVNTLMKPCRP